jgi:predicted double-glycine peptidase
MKRRLSAMSALAGALLLPACAAVPADDGRFEIATHAGALTLASAPRSMVETRFDTVVRQQFDFSCGSAALATLLTYHYDKQQGEGEVFRGMWRDGDKQAIQRLGFSLLDMKRYLAAQGMVANGYRVDLDQVAGANTPGIALIAPDGYRHFVVVKGVEDDFVLVGDPSLGLRRMDRDQFEKDWNGVYFVVTDGAKINHPAFNTDAQWERVAAFGADQSMFEPVSQQVLTLTAAGFGEF